MSSVIALLGPTNTGKTFTAMERMLAHQTGLMGFPLRLLARENYEKACRQKGKDNVALITGEEKIIPPRARYYMCTVESMPLDLGAEFIAVDEIQLAGDVERGHVFTDRLFHMRGVYETMFLGAQTIEPLLKKLLPDIEIRTQPRFSTLSYTSPKKLSRIPRRSAVIVFSASQVYETAEFLRVHRGGCSVVLGALSPRTRNAQVHMYQMGEVDYLVGTDAIGMGLNLDLEHVTFARLHKFDGRRQRRLRAEEIGQIAGRAGRHTRDGTFSTTSNVGGIEETQISMVENHMYMPLRHLNWRNPNLRFESIDALRRSLEVLPNDPHLERVSQADDQTAFQTLSRESAIRDLCQSPAAVRLLWDVCQIPDFRKTLMDQHHSFQQTLFTHLIKDGQIPEIMVEEQIERLNKDSGDIDTLVNRIAAIRTWAYITHHGDWVAGSQAWAARTRAVDDKLSDALHKRLTQRFVDRRTAFLVQKLRSGDTLMCHIDETGKVSVDSAAVGQLRGFRFIPESSASNSDQVALLTVAHRSLGPEMSKRLARLESDNDGAFRLDETGVLRWREARIGCLVKGESLWAPQISLDTNEFLNLSQRTRILQRLTPWLKAYLKNRLAAFYVLRDPRLTGVSRGLAFQLWEEGGLIMRHDKALIANLNETDKALLTELKIHVTRRTVFVRSVFNAKIWPLRALLWTLFNQPESPPDLPSADQGSLQDFSSFKGCKSYLRQFGFVELKAKGNPCVYVRADRLDRLESKLYALFKNSQDGVFTLPADIGDPLNLKGAALQTVLTACSYQVTDAPVNLSESTDEHENEHLYYRRFFPKKRSLKHRETAISAQAKTSKKQKAIVPKARKHAKRTSPNPDSPFAVLAALKS